MTWQTFLFIIIIITAIVVLKGKMRFEGDNMKVSELNSIIKEGKLSERKALVLDVREGYEFKEGHIKGALNISLGEIEGNIEKIKKYETAYVICHSGARSAMACRVIKNLCAGSVNPINVEGGMSAWLGANFEYEK